MLLGNPQTTHILAYSMQTNFQLKNLIKNIRHPNTGSYYKSINEALKVITN